MRAAREVRPDPRRRSFYDRRYRAFRALQDQERALRGLLADG
jgi:hypothetical protein